MNVCISYTAVLQLVDDISKYHKDPIQQWIKDGATFKFIGDNIDKKKRVRDMRSDHQEKMIHMYSVLVSKSRLQLSQTLPAPLCVANNFFFFSIHFSVSLTFQLCNGFRRMRLN